MMRIAALVIVAVAASSAQAKDPPRSKANPPQSGCEWVGPDFVKLEGSDTCVKVGGSVRAEFSTSSGGSSYDIFSK